MVRLLGPCSCARTCLCVCVCVYIYIHIYIYTYIYTFHVSLFVLHTYMVSSQNHVPCLGFQNIMGRLTLIIPKGSMIPRVHVIEIYKRIGRKALLCRMLEARPMDQQASCCSVRFPTPSVLCSS